MDRHTYSFGERVKADVASPGTLDDKFNLSFDYVEASANERDLDKHPYGIISGMSVVEAASPNMTVRVLAGVAYDQTGQRIEVPSTQSISMETDFNGDAIALPTGGNEKYASVFAKFKRSNQSATQDDNSVAYFHTNLESFEIRVRAGSSASTGTATPPALQGSEILLADVLLTPGMTTVTTGDIELLDRRQDAWKLSPTNVLPKQIRVGTAKAAVTQLLDWLNDLLDGTLTLDTLGVTHTNGAETFAGAVAPPTSGALQTWLRALVTALGASTGTTGGQRIGNASLGQWANGADAGVAGALGTQVIGIVTALAASTGLVRIGGAAASQTPTSLTAGTAQNIVEQLLTAVNARARKAAIETISAVWTFSSVPVIAFTPTGGVAATTVAGAIAELDTEKAALAGATFTGEVRQPRLNASVQDVGVIGANTQVTNDVGLVIVQSPAADTTEFNLALPEPAAGNPVLFLKFRGGAGVGPRDVYITNTASIGTVGTNYYALWSASTSNKNGGATFAWDGARWRLISHYGLVDTDGAGTLVD